MVKFCLFFYTVNIKSNDPFTQWSYYRISRRDYLVREIGFKPSYKRVEASWVTKMVKNPPPIQETKVQSLGQEDPLEKGMATHFSIIVWRIPWTEEPGRL